MPSKEPPVPNPTAASASAPAPSPGIARPAVRLRCDACGIEVKAVGWRPGMAASCKKCGKALRPLSTPPAATSSADTIRPESLDPLIGATLGGCRITRKIGSGGMGAVYEGKHVGLDKIVAIKILPPEFTSHATAVERFQREARAAAKLEHANIVQVLNVGQENGYNYIVMQFVEGESLGKLVARRKALPWREALKYVREAARGLASAHAAGVVHRDIKPDNILVAKDGVTKVADFGLARTLDSGVSLSTTGQIMGTPDYMSPEQAQAVGTDGRSDIYSLGATFYFLLTARKPFLADTPLSIIMKHVSEPLRPLREINKDIPEAVEHVVAKMMAKKPGDRFADCNALIAALDELDRGGKPVSASDLPAIASPGAATQVVLPAESGARGLLFAGAGIGAVLVFAAIVVAMVKSRHEDPPAPPKPVAETPAPRGTDPERVTPPVTPPKPDIPPADGKEVPGFTRSLADAIAARNWTGARAALASLRQLSASPEYAGRASEIAGLADKIRAHDDRVASGTLADLPDGGERWTFEFDHDESDSLEIKPWLAPPRFAEKGFLAGTGVITPRANPEVLDGVLHARLKFIEREKRKPGSDKPGRDLFRPSAGFGMRLQDDGEAWAGALEDLDGDKVKAMIGHLTQIKPKVEVAPVKSQDYALPGDEYFDLWFSCKGKHVAVGVGDKEIVSVDDDRLMKPGNLFFYSKGSGVKLDRLVFERVK